MVTKKWSSVVDATKYSVYPTSILLAEVGATNLVVVLVEEATSILLIEVVANNLAAVLVEEDAAASSVAIQVEFFEQVATIPVELEDAAIAKDFVRTMDIPIEDIRQEGVAAIQAAKIGLTLRTMET